MKRHYDFTKSHPFGVRIPVKGERQDVSSSLSQLGEMNDWLHEKHLFVLTDYVTFQHSGDRFSQKRQAGYFYFWFRNWARALDFNLIFNGELLEPTE